MFPLNVWGGEQLLCWCILYQQKSCSLLTHCNLFIKPDARLSWEPRKMFKCQAAWDRATDEWIYKEKTCTSSSPPKKTHTKKNWDAVPEGVNNTNGAETEAHSSIPGDAAHILLSVCSLLLCCTMRVYLFPSVCAWSVCACTLVKRCVCFAVCVSVSVTCLYGLSACCTWQSASWLAGLTEDDQPI